MTKLHRKELKHDEVRDKIVEAIQGITFHGREVLYLATIVIAIGFIAFAWSYYEKHQQQESQDLLGVAMAKFQTQVGAQADPTDPTKKPEYQYKSDAEKYADALKDFEVIIQKYSNTPAADIARYNAGVCAFYLKDYPKAEGFLVQSTRVSDRNVLYYLTRKTLASVYAASGKTDLAVKTLQEAVSNNKDYVPAEDLLLQLAVIYKDAGKTKEAIDTYQKIVDQFKDTSAGFQAQNQLTELKGAK